MKAWRPQCRLQSSCIRSAIAIEPSTEVIWVTENRQVLPEILWSSAYLLMEVSGPVSGECYRHNMWYHSRILHTDHEHTHTQTHMYTVFICYMHAYMYMHTNIHTYTMVALWNWLLLISSLFTLYLSISVIIITQGNGFYDYALFFFWIAQIILLFWINILEKKYWSYNLLWSKVRMQNIANFH